MPDWRRLVRARLNGLDLPPADEIAIVDELAQHIEDRYRDLCSAGKPEEDALAESLQELDSGDFAAELRDSVSGKDEASD